MKRSPILGAVLASLVVVSIVISGAQSAMAAPKAKRLRAGGGFGTVTAAKTLYQQQLDSCELDRSALNQDQASYFVDYGTTRNEKHDAVSADLRWAREKRDRACDVPRPWNLMRESLCDSDNGVLNKLVTCLDKLESEVLSAQ